VALSQWRQTHKGASCGCGTLSPLRSPATMERSSEIGAGRTRCHAAIGMGRSAVRRRGELQQRILTNWDFDGADVIALVPTRQGYLRAGDPVRRFSQERFHTKPPWR